jgi:hypothetical protein
MNTHPRFHNKQTSVLALGLAHSGAQALYLSAAGPSVALKSLWASAVGHNSAGFYCHPWCYDPLHGAAGIQSFYQPLPHSTVHHLVAVRSHPSCFLVAHPTAATLTAVHERQQLLEQLFQTQVLPGFGLWLNDQTVVPVLDAWLPALWTAAVDPHHPAHAAQPGIVAGVCYGDCLGAWEVDPAYDWLRLVQWLLSAGELTF